MKTTNIALAVAGVLLSAPSFAANIILNNVDPPGVGFNDPTPAVPVGGNAGTTIGAQRLIAYERALELWGKTLKSDATIVVQGSFRRLTCDAAGGTLAQAGALQIFANFPNAPLTNHWYGVALASALAGADLTPGPLDPGPLAPPFNDDIVANFNGDVGRPDCIAGPGWYYGLDNNATGGRIDFLDTFMHEVAHGLGFQNFANEATGTLPGGLPDVYMANTLDLDRQRLWNTFTPAEIVASAVNNTRVVWAGARVSENAGLVLGEYEGIRVTGALSGEIEFGAASFGPPATLANFSGEIVVAQDGVAAPGGGTVLDGCEPFTTNVTGKIAMVDRGFCGFLVKAQNAQAAGARALIIANNLGRPSFGPGGTDPAITIPAIGISNQDGDRIRAAAGAVNAEVFVDPTRLAGSTDGYVRLYAPRTVALGSSISHFDTSAAPNLLMEPFITDTLRSSVNLDLTPSLMQDIGWQLETLKIGSCETGVTSVLPDGDMLHARLGACAAAGRNHGQFVSCVNGVVNQARKDGYITGPQKASIIRCAARTRN